MSNELTVHCRRIQKSQQIHKQVKHNKQNNVYTARSSVLTGSQCFYVVSRLFLVVVSVYSTKICHHFYYIWIEDINFSHNFSLSQQKYVVRILVLRWFSNMTTIHVYCMYKSFKQQASRNEDDCVWCRQTILTTTETQIMRISMHKCPQYLPQGWEYYVLKFVSDIILRTNILDFYFVLVSCPDFHFSCSLIIKNSKKYRHFRCRYCSHEKTLLVAYTQIFCCIPQYEYTTSCKKI